jgi:hypothetical protein
VSADNTVPNCDFYALATDLVCVLDFVFAQPGWSLLELASRHDQPLREFHATREVLDAYPTFDLLETSLDFHLYCPSMGGQVFRRRIDFKAGAVPGATFRYDSEGWGLIQVYFGRVRAGRLSPCHTNHNSQRRAETWEPTSRGQLGPVAAWNWDEVVRVSGRLVRFVRGASVAKLGSRPILHAAQEARARGAVEFALHRH